jgi:hypothetical protein
MAPPSSSIFYLQAAKFGDELILTLESSLPPVQLIHSIIPMVELPCTDIIAAIKNDEMKSYDILTDIFSKKEYV